MSNLKIRDMAKKCPRCGSKNTVCINRVEQIGDGIKKI